MNKKHRFRELWILPAAALALAGAAGADTGWYLGASWGATSFRHEIDDFSDGSLAGGAVDESDSGWKVFAGYGWTRHLAIEAGLSQLNNDFDGKTTFFAGVSDGSGSTFAEGGVGVDIHRPRSGFVTIVAILPLAGRTSLRGKLGIHSWETEWTIFDSSGIREVDETGTAPMAGLGLEHVFAGRWAVRAEWERFTDIVNDDIDLLSIGLRIAVGPRVETEAERTRR